LKGVTVIERYGDQEVTVTYDDEKTSVKQMLELLKQKGYPVKGSPIFVQ
jgi:hypothetical protein